MARRVALVSDSTSVDAAMAARLDVIVVPLQVVIGETSYDEGTGASPQMVAVALRDHSPVSTSRPAPEQFARVYRNAAAAGAESVVSIHLSSEVSGTVESAQLAARAVDVEVLVVDSRHLGMGTGFAVAAAAAALDDGATAAEAAHLAYARARSTTGLFYVDTLEFLRRGGRVGAAAALVGSALAVKPLLQIDDGRIVPAREGAYVEPGADPARGDRGAGCRRARTSTSRSRTWRTRSGRSDSPNACTRGCPDRPARGERGRRRHRCARWSRHARRRRLPPPLLTIR